MSPDDGSRTTYTDIRRSTTMSFASFSHCPYSSTKESHARTSHQEMTLPIYAARVDLLMDVTVVYLPVASHGCFAVPAGGVALDIYVVDRLVLAPMVVSRLWPSQYLAMLSRFAYRRSSLPTHRPVVLTIDVEPLGWRLRLILGLAWSTAVTAASSLLNWLDRWALVYDRVDDGGLPPRVSQLCRWVTILVAPLAPVDERVYGMGSLLMFMVAPLSSCHLVITAVLLMNDRVTGALLTVVAVLLVMVSTLLTTDTMLVALLTILAALVILMIELMTGNPLMIKLLILMGGYLVIYTSLRLIMVPLLSVDMSLDPVVMAFLLDVVDTVGDDLANDLGCNVDVLVVDLAGGYPALVDDSGCTGDVLDVLDGDRWLCLRGTMISIGLMMVSVLVKYAVMALLMSIDVKIGVDNEMRLNPSFDVAILIMLWLVSTEGGLQVDAALGVDVGGVLDEVDGRKVPVVGLGRTVDDRSCLANGRAEGRRCGGRDLLTEAASLDSLLAVLLMLELSLLAIDHLPLDSLTIGVDLLMNE
ncbi:hypothetical protein BDK51DRAFT_48083 [Blyttiomyces helicus]|uniref:Uncharacterized protein n=1 Tax=Blyttiomyces helicus TaxID=388810 RepID=A0A4P9WRG3_9FUNG|nr:hypothetical protein BDK51DRAFT_48083 [Blyttiomyces helicus]|eukprot:RKO94458.1 hypothetical protein BDK51DRAFT_48083 [Blyttiomyces helicus]